MENKAFRIFILSLAAMAVCDCAGLNPNIGTRTADDAYQRGDCATAMDIYERNAQNGQPWAQMRLGMVYYEGRCEPKDDALAMSWLKKAATYEAKTDWEMGKEFSTGPTGFFNTRATSANASMLLSHMYLQGAGTERNPVLAWLWANHAVSIADNADKVHLETRLSLMEHHMSPAELQHARELAKSWPIKD